MWTDPYLETCCRAALHRLVLSAPAPRPAEGKDLPCLRRLAGMGLATARADGGFDLTAAGRERHRREILREGPLRPAAPG
ncbi:MAG TPA: hypothetical protein VNL71_02450 [Chloroflexota bacterium]|nr:hypothetical protein [Chloroflexota bacterium]